MTIYGLTGGIACGKSTLAKMMRERGWIIVDSDEIAHRLMEPDQINWKKVVDAFGDKIINADRTINRSALGDLVFSDPALRQQLNALTHPAIRQAWQAEKDRFLNSHPTRPMVLVIPLLFECGLQQEVSAVLCVACSPALQLRRILSRGIDMARAQARIASQLPLCEKINLSRYVFWNEGSLDSLRLQLDQLD